MINTVSLILKLYRGDLGRSGHFSHLIFSAIVYLFSYILQWIRITEIQADTVQWKQNNSFLSTKNEIINFRFFVRFCHMHAVRLNDLGAPLKKHIFAICGLNKKSSLNNDKYLHPLKSKSHNLISFVLIVPPELCNCGSII